MSTQNQVNVFYQDNQIEWEQVGEGVERKIMAFDQSLMLVKASFQKGSIGPIHQHPHSQITHVEKGVFEVSISGEKKILQQGDAFYIPPNELHGAVCLEAGILIDVFSPMREDFIK